MGMRGGFDRRWEVVELEVFFLFMLTCTHS